jgi:pyridine nucleotide-disulfide oxidoreductase family protein
MTDPTLRMKSLLLLGAGHAHAQVLRDWAARPLHDVELTVVSPSALAPYSGMVPGWLAGSCAFEDICIDFAALARAAGARLLEDEVIACDAGQKQVMLRSGTVLGADVLSINIGSTLRPPAVAGAQVLAMRPLGALRERWETRLSALAMDTLQGPLTLTVVGGGAAGVETLLCAHAHLRAMCPQRPITPRLITRSPALLQGMSPMASRLAQQALAARGAELHLGVGFDDAPSAPTTNEHLVLWATGAQAHHWPARSGLATGDDGFIRIDAQLRSVSHPCVLAVGDCAQWGALGEPGLPKAGVYAVRMGPVLANNLRAALGRGSWQTYTPQRRYLALLATGDGAAIATWGPLAARGRWAWRWKDRIDRGFIAGFAAP